MPKTTDYNYMSGTAIVTIAAGGSVSTVAAMGGCVLRAFIPVTYPISGGTVSINCAPIAFDGTSYPLVTLHQQKTGNDSYYDGSVAAVRGISAGTYYSFDVGDNFDTSVQLINYGTVATAATFLLIGRPI